MDDRSEAEKIDFGPADDWEYFCVSVVQPHVGLTRDQVVRRVGGDPASVLPWDGSPDVLSEPPGEATYLLSQAGGAWVLAKCWGFEGSRPSVARALSDGATVLVWFHGFNSAKFIYARDRRVVTAFEPTIPYPPQRFGETPRRWTPTRRLVTLADADDARYIDLQRAAVRLLRSRTELALDQQWWHGDHRLVTTPPLPDDPTPAPVGIHGALHGALHGVETSALHRVLRQAVETAAEATDIRTAAPVQRALRDGEQLHARARAGDDGLRDGVAAALGRFIPFAADVRETSSPRDGDPASRFARAEGPAPRSWKTTRCGTACKRFTPSTLGSPSPIRCPRGRTTPRTWSLITVNTRCTPDGPTSSRSS